MRKYHVVDVLQSYSDLEHVKNVSESNSSVNTDPEIDNH